MVRFVLSSVRLSSHLPSPLSAHLETFRAARPSRGEELLEPSSLATLCCCCVFVNSRESEGSFSNGISESFVCFVYF